jgi:hypothetical protein
VTLQKNAGTRFWISGSPDSLTNWACDDRLYVEYEGQEPIYIPPVGFDAVLDPTFPTCRPIESIVDPVGPREITDYLPDGVNCVAFLLADTQREIYGNTEIYLIKEIATGIDTRSQAPPVTRLQVFPNPARHGSVFRVGAGNRGLFTLQVYDPGGRRIRAFPAVLLQRGQSHDWFWDGTGPRGAKVTTGVYFYSLQGPATRLSGSVVILR